jgi:hypothetical protein
MQRLGKAALLFAKTRGAIGLAANREGNRRTQEDIILLSVRDGETNRLGGFQQSHIKGKELDFTFEQTAKHTPCLPSRCKMNRIVGSQGKPLSQLAGVLQHIFIDFDFLDGLIPVVLKATQMVREFCSGNPPKMNHTGKADRSLREAQAANQEYICGTPPLSQTTNPSAPILVDEEFD